MAKKKTIITVALQGATGSKANNPNTPITPEELAEDAYNCWKAGAAVVHLHQKMDDGVLPSMDVEKFRRTRELIEAKGCDIIVNMTTSGEYDIVDDCKVLGKDSMKKNDQVRQGVLEISPEIGSYDVATMNFNRLVYINSLPFLEEMGLKMQKYGVKPEVEIFDLGDIKSTLSLIESGHLVNPQLQLCLGVLGGASATVEHLMFMAKQIPDGLEWGAFGIGSAHLPIMYTTLALGGHVRVGLEDNLYYEKGVLTTNVALVERAAQVVKLFGNDVATPDEAREIMKIQKRK